jgi:agmatinase
MPWIAGMTQIGLRGLGNSKEKDFKDAKKWGSKIISDQKMTKMSSEQMIKHIPNKIPLYLTLDLDGINPVEFPGVVSRAPGGPGISKIVELILAIGKNKNLIGANLVEFAPSKDIDNISLNATIRLLMLIIHILNKKK